MHTGNRWFGSLGLLSFLGVALAILPSHAPAGVPNSPVSREALDYLIQDVCLDVRGAVAVRDPATCPHRRNVALNEPSPYILADRGKAARRTYSGVTSLPITLVRGRGIIVTKSMAGGFAKNFTFAFDPARDAYDLLDIAHSPYASIVRTHDGGCGDQLFARAPLPVSLGDRAGGWVLFPLTAPSGWPAVSHLIVTTHRIQLSKGHPARCKDGSSTGRTDWYRPIRIQFESGKRLVAIRSDHFAAADLSRQNNAMERFYFTREYGFTRWESWIPLSRCIMNRTDRAAVCHPGALGNPLNDRCGAAPISLPDSKGFQDWGEQRWVRIDCRDHTNFIALTTPQLMLSPFMGRSHGLVDIATP